MSKKITGEEVAYEGKFLQVKKYKLQSSIDSTEHVYECLERADSVCAVVFNKETDKYLFVKQFRVGAKKEMIELVAGMVEKEDASLEDCIIREIQEELGYSVNKDDVRFLYSFYSSPGASTEKMHLFYVDVDQKISAGGGIHDEDIEIVEFTADELMNVDMFEDVKTILGAVWVNS
ncbi:MAG: NUDIX hydrolase [Bacteroidia bacterium]|nr:NUDIX hydrolase [Bacteroidia bacterium]